MNTNGPIPSAPPERWAHTHTCYTCQGDYPCTWAYCQAQAQRDCPACRTANRAPQPQEETP